MNAIRAGWLSGAVCAALSALNVSSAAEPLLVASIEASSAVAERSNAFAALSESERPVGSGGFVASVPQFALKCVLGNDHRSAELYRENGMVLVISAPTLSHAEKTRRWAKFIKKGGWPETNAPRCVVLEDLSQQKDYREKALSVLTERASEEKRVAFLIDESGETRRSFHVGESETVVLVVDRHGRIVHHESNDVEPDAETGRRVAKIVRAMSGAK